MEMEGIMAERAGYLFALRQFDFCTLLLLSDVLRLIFIEVLRPAQGAIVKILHG